LIRNYQASDFLNSGTGYAVSSQLGPGLLDPADMSNPKRITNDLLKKKKMSPRWPPDGIAPAGRATSAIIDAAEPAGKT